MVRILVPFALSEIFTCCICRCSLDFVDDALDIYESESAPVPSVSYSLIGSKMTGQFVPRALKAINNRQSPAVVERKRPTKAKTSVTKQKSRAEAKEHSDRSLVDTIIAQDKLSFCLEGVTRIGQQASIQEVRFLSVNSTKR
jgi:hypothetical protein